MRIKDIIKAIDTFLKLSGKLATTPKEANAVLHMLRLSNQSRIHGGFNVRRMLRQGKIPHGYQPKGKWSEWVIPHS